MVEASWPTGTSAISTEDADGEPIDTKLPNAMMQNQLQAQSTILKLMERRAKYIGGLESPVQLDIKHEVTTPDKFAAYLLGAREAFDRNKAES